MSGRICVDAGSKRKITTAKLLVGSSLLALLIGGTVGPSQASAQQTTGRVHEFHIASQPLDKALNQLAEQAGVQLAYKTANVGTRSASALNGAMTTEQALSRLLSGTGLRYTFSSANAVTISGAQDTAANDAGVAGATVLAPIEVKGVSATTEGTNSYNASAVSVAGKIAVPVREIPNSVSVITRKQMDDQNLDSVDDALRQTPGVTAVNYGDGTYYFQSRGYPLDAQYDGMPVPGGVQYQPQFDLSIYDRVEVLKGPAGLLQGSGSGPAGTANFVRKAASDQFSLTTDTQIGSWNFYRSSVDVTGPLNQDGTVRGRLVVTGQDRDFFYDDGHERHGTAYGNLAFDVTPDTTVTLSGAYQHEDNGPFDYGQAVYSDGSFLKAPRSAYFGADWNDNTQNIGEGYANVEHRFDSDWVWNTTMLYRHIYGPPAHYAYMNDVVDPATNLADYAIQSGDYSQSWFGLDSNASGSYELFGREHKLLIGANYSRIETTQLSGYEDAGLFNIFDAGSIPYADVPYGYNNQEVAQQWGLYAQTRLSITDPLTVILGGRESWYEAKNRSVLPTDGDWSDDPAVRGKFTPYVGAVYDLTKQFSVYASYAEIFTPQTNLTASGTGVAPRVGNQYEVGFKGDFFDGALSATLAAFDIHDKNRAITDPDNPLFYVAAGSARSRGIEFTLSGEVTSNWSVMAGYTYLETKYLDDPDNAGDILDPEEPRHSFKLWNRYTFDTGALRNVSLGAGARIISSTERGVISQGGYAVFDAQIGYKINDHAQFTLTANNLFDRVYFDRIPTQYFGLYGEPRSIMADLKVKW